MLLKATNGKKKKKKTTEGSAKQKKKARVAKVKKAPNVKKVPKVKTNLQDLSAKSRQQIFEKREHSKVWHYHMSAYKELGKSVEACKEFAKAKASAYMTKLRIDIKNNTIQVKL